MPSPPGSECVCFWETEKDNAWVVVGTRERRREREHQGGEPAPDASEVAMASATTLAPGTAVPNGGITMVSSGKEPTGRAAAAAVLSVSTPEKAMSEELKE